MEREALRVPHRSATFHGRDIFAPAAAHLAAGVPLERLGPPLREIRYLDIAMPRRQSDGSAEGVIIHIDAFGNAVTNVRREDVPEGDLEVRTGSARIQGLAQTYAERDGPLALWGSSGYLEIAVRNGSAAAALGLARGDAVVVRGVRPV